MILQTTDPYNTILKHQLQKTDTIIGENQSVLHTLSSIPQ